MLITSTQMPLPFPNSGYLLIEPSNLSADLADLLPEMHPCVPPFLWNAEASMPRLLRLDKLASSKREAVSQILEQEILEQYPPVACAWLESDSDTEELANCVARFIYGRGADGSRVIWRYYDPRVFVLTAHLFSEEKVNALLGPIKRWTFSWRRQWWCVERKSPFVPSTADLDLGWPDSLDWKLLSKSRLFHRLHARLDEDGLLPPRCLDELSHSTTAFLETEKYLHLDNDDQRADFAYFSTRYRKYFRENHELLPTWEKLRKREITLQQMMANIASDDVKIMERNINDTRRF